MALTAYQQQFKRRMKRAISLRDKADQKARRYTKLLSDAIGAAEDAVTQMNELNQFYNVDVSTYPLLTKALHANSGQEVLVDHLVQSTPGEEVVLFNQVPDGNGGQPLPANPRFGGLVARTPIIQPVQTAKIAAPEKVLVPDVSPALWDAARGIAGTEALSTGIDKRESRPLSDRGRLSLLSLEAQQRVAWQ